MRIDFLRNLSFRRRRKTIHRLTAPQTGPFSRKSFPIWIEAPPYEPLSGGVRAMNLLCYHLNRLGYDAFIIDRPRQNRAPFPLRYLDRSIVMEQRREGREPIVVYPEVTVGNPREARFVVRYLLNTPGLLVAGAESSYGRDDYFIDGAREHAPAGVRSFDLFMPLVDSEIYRPPTEGSVRHGFVVFTNRATVDPASLPDWLDPRIVLSMKAPRTHAELGALYRQSRAMVTFERTSAIFEALSCGCPVICMAAEHFNEATYHPRFRDGGLIWGWHEGQLEQAAGKTATFRAIYRELERSLDERVQIAFDWILQDVWRRVHNSNSAP